MGVAHTYYTSGVGFKVADHVSFTDLDNRSRYDYPNDSYNRHPHSANECLLQPGECKDSRCVISVRLDVSGANEEAELIYLLTLGTSHHPNYLPRRAL